MSDYSEDTLVEQPAIALFAEMGWETVYGYHEFNQTDGNPLGREAQSEVVLEGRLRSVLERLNPDLPADAFDQAMEELIRDRGAMAPAQANREVYLLLKNGVRVKIRTPDGEGETVESVRLIDWKAPANNDFLLVSQFWVTGEMYTRRADLVGFINGIPLVFIELKATHARLEKAYTENLSDYKCTIPQLFWYNALIVLSNGSRSRIGSITASWEHFTEWKKINNEGEEGVVSLETMIRGTCDKARLLDLVENFTLFMKAQGGWIKLLGKNHQYLGVNNVIDALRRIESRAGRLGVFWHTQGSGKSVSMICFAQKVLRKIPGNWTFVIITDRQELDHQIYKNFAASGAVTEEEAQATSGRHLRQLLMENHRYVFTLIHKFRTERGEKHPVLSERSDIIVITDEAHRSQYDTLALNMRTALPNASFIAFTGTPLIIGEEKTREVFGDYVSVYNFRQSMEDGATVPLYYENRIPELQLINENLNEDMERLLEDAELDAAQEKKLEREFTRQYHLITREERLETIAEDLVSHFTGRGFPGKAMVISIDKATAVRMYDKVQVHWKAEMLRLMDKMAEEVDDEKRQAIRERIQFMESSDMAVVVSSSQNEIEEMKAKGLDIAPHRKRMVSEDLETKFKDPDDPFRIVFVCAMWLTGFDAPSCSTLYLDKPMRNHTLMQTIARANRVFKEKVNGLIVDYVGVFRNLEKALEIYGTGSSAGEDSPVKDKAALVALLRQSIVEMEEFCSRMGVNLDAIEATSDFEKIKLLDDAREALIANDDSKKRYLTQAAMVGRLYKAILPDSEAKSSAARYQLFDVLAKKIRALTPPTDISEVVGQVEELLNESIDAEGYVVRTTPPVFGAANDVEEHWVDLAQMDFEALKERFAKGKKRTEMEILRGQVNSKLKQMLRLNRTRIDYQERFQKMIDEYNAGSVNIDEYFQQLLAFAKSLNDEEKRSVAEQLSEEELVVFDILTKPRIDLSNKETKQVKKAARGLLQALKREQLVLDWRKFQQSRAAVKIHIEDVLEEGLPESVSPRLFQQKVEAVYQHVYDSYYGGGRGVYAAAA
ncbi:MAG: type I restriction endonuclease subunit R [Rhodothermaceae bacterium]|nr:type I restriction endonuclease subunit R [Rhodothermaceae bacterium]MXZ58345.1 type I restriction endonuclease subunit R [Rhodothermaceae bacterium]MYB91143.1 type I restriction endonuclease subunit R [Rhodothermaceae bacterium]MYD67196.1 type I restriction endonuclease subunit R [Rhodothermaceae bacterium]MYG44574.1 type I restriction endonuclease subunit R [Rhodothermaceae bacterium]